MADKTNEIAAFTDEALNRAIAERACLYFEPVRLVGPHGVAGDYFENYARTIKNRMLDLFDDALLLLRAERVPSACIVSRCMIETYAVAFYFCSQVEDALAKGGLIGAQDEILKFINSSRAKVDEQKRVAKGVFALDDYHFTKQARSRMEQELAETVHISKALKALYADEMGATGSKESKFEFTYGMLCEWTHPSQTSLLHAYAEDAQLVETSVGLIPHRDGARMACVQGMHFITAVGGQYDHMRQAAAYLRTLKA